MANTLDLSQVEVIVYLDDDDTLSHELNDRALKVVKIIGPRMTMGAYNTTCMKAASGDVFVLANDDMVIKTKGWEERVRKIHERFSDRIYLAYGNDLFKGAKLCSFPILSRRTCELIGDPYPEVYRRAFIDGHLLDIFRRLQKLGSNRICYDSDLIFEHLHYRTGKSPFDETYRQARLGRFADDINFISLTELRSVCAKRLVARIEGKAIPDLPAIRIANMPTSLPVAVVSYFILFVRDRGLPWRYRFYLWYWFIGRYMASKGWLRPFVSP